MKSGKVTVRYTRGILERFELSLIGEEAKKLKATLASLSFEKWENSYCCDCVLDGEAWDLEITFVDGTKKSVDGSNAYPKCWKKFLKMIENLRKYAKAQQNAISLEEARKIARKHNKKITSYREYPEGYHFYCGNAETDGGGYDFVVLKSTGEILSMAAFISDYCNVRMDK